MIEYNAILIKNDITVKLFETVKNLKSNRKKIKIELHDPFPLITGVLDNLPLEVIWEIYCYENKQSISPHISYIINPRQYLAFVGGKNGEYGSKLFERFSDFDIDQALFLTENSIHTDYNLAIQEVKSDLEKFIVKESNLF
tara:strand:- start:1430 stop:1852 length:423 start_codon:yes stop_codon:yes gene_type:complete